MTVDEAPRTLDGSSGDVDGAAGGAPGGTMLPVASMLAAVVVAAWLPFRAFREFYLSGDHIAQWLPVSRRIGQLVANGDSHLMDPTMWRSGNFVAEARFGLWNPLMVALDMTVLQLDDLAVAMLIVVIVSLCLLASGVYLLAREYGSSPWMSALGGVVAATGGWTIWMDASWWIPQVVSLAFAPFVWVAARRVAQGRIGPLWLVVAGAMCVTVGNPYSNIVVFVIVVAVAVETTRALDRRALVRLASLAAGLVAIGLIAVFVYLPFRQTSAVGFRESGLANDENWAPDAGHFLLLSSPTATPFVPHFGREVLGFPAMYLSWFVLPLAPWMRWRSLARREFAGLGVFAASMLLLSLGPSDFWLFRWPIRLVPYVFLPVTVVAAIVLSAGLATDRRAMRTSLSAGAVALGTYLAWADVPTDVRWHLAAGTLIAFFFAGALFIARRAPAALAPALMVSTLVMLVVQLEWRPQNESVGHYGMPTSASDYDRLYGDRFDGNVVQVANVDSTPPDLRTADAVYRDIALGSSIGIGDVESVSMYSGIGFVTHDQALCLRFDGAMCADAWTRLWQPVGSSGANLADVIRAETVVVQRLVVETVEAPPPPGWEVAEFNETAVVWQRTNPLPWPDGRLSDVTGPIAAVDAVADGPHREVVSIVRAVEPGGDSPVAGVGQLTFARLAWPGYEATIDGRVLPVGGGPAGLLTVDIPADVGDGDIVLTWRPPFWKVSLLALGLGLALGLVSQVAWRRFLRART